MKTVAALAVLLLLTACSNEPSPQPTAAASSSTPAAAPTRATPQEVVEDPEAPTYRGWRPGNPTGPRKPLRKAPEPVPAFRDANLLQQPTTSLQEGVSAVVAGGDGATLFPFTHTARSLDRGRTWTTYDIAKVDGETAFTSGAVVLPDGRLLALLANWTDDRRDQPSDRHHGLFVSEGDDWSRYSPVTPTFRPEPGPTLHGWPNTQALEASPDHGGVIWITTADQRVFASTDGAQTFSEIRAR